jgi:hypothetical protein
VNSAMWGACWERFKPRPKPSEASLPDFAESAGARLIPLARPGGRQSERGQPKRLRTTKRHARL